MNKKFFFLFFLFFLLFSLFYALVPTLSLRAAPTELTISSAMSLKEVFSQLGQEFETLHKGQVHIDFHFAGSGFLQQQIMAGAPVDLFASAAPEEMNQLEKEQLLSPSSRMNFAGNSLILIQTRKNLITTLQELTLPQIKRVAMGNPKTVPAGRYAEEALRSLQLYEKIKSKLVYGENVRQVLDYVSRGEVEAGIVFGTELSTRHQVHLVGPFPEKSHSPIVYTLAILKKSPHLSWAQKWAAFLQKESSRQTLAQYGFR